MGSWPILSTVAFMPLVGAVILFFVPINERSRQNILTISLFVSLLTFIIALFIWIKFI